MVNQKEWKNILFVIIYFVIGESLGYQVAIWFLCGMLTLATLIGLYNIIKSLKSKLRDFPVEGQFLFNREKDIYLFYGNQVLVLMGIYILLIGILMFQWPLNWMVADSGVILLIISYIIEWNTKGRGDIFSGLDEED
ncbi:hypothetical protein [Macrococcus brunensis]|uniref:hypothetical protein n=1 Tax=Macrococcus brunensis TaxID=198483 RepID=UPI001EF10E30|nr:hypothetical protein [Macrococcus brunensis]ULG72296.1 hypothetical protein MGG12_01865 [Macrococcus brunensis]